tara:strand:+ start:34 stop:306 length:273 start_codon:yes stop_codon:yes gene_type:complete
VSSKNKNRLSKSEKHELVLKAISQFGDRGIYDVSQSTLGMALYVHADTREDSKILRKLIPTDWNGLYTIVLYTEEPEDFEYENEDLYDPA